jgi:DnaK suppressor protein
MAATTAAATDTDTEDSSPITTGELDRFRVVLEEKRLALVKSAQASLEQDMQLDTNELPDEVDLASSEYIQSFALRLRGRERNFLDKIEKALKKIQAGEFGMCEECDEPIGRKRLEARPETTLCIRCKEDQERSERDFKG